MTVYFAGGEDIDFVNTTGLSVTTTAALRITGRCSVYNTTETGYLTPNHADFTLNEVWVRADIAVRAGTSGSVGQYAARFMRGVSKDTFACGIKVVTSRTGLGPNSLGYQLVIDDGTGTLVEGPKFSLPDDAITLQLHVKIVGGKLRFFVYNDANFDVIAGFVATLNSSYSITGIQFGTGGAAASWAISKIVIADEQTYKWSVAIQPPTANGSDTAWTGAYTTIDETTLTYTDVMTTDTVNAKRSYTTAAYTIPSGHEIKGIGIAIAARKNGGSLSTLNPYMKKSSVDYESPSIVTNAAAMFRVWRDTDPATGVRFTTSDASSGTIFQIGFHAVS